MNRFERFATKVSDAIGSKLSLFIHATIIGSWVLASILFKVDPGIVVLTGVLTIEGIFLLIFLLVDEKAQARRVEEVSEEDLEETRELRKLVEKSLKRR